MTKEKLEMVTLYIKFSRAWYSANENQKEVANNWGKLAIIRINKLKTHETKNAASVLIKQINYLRERTLGI
jgi:hypothetical protein